MSKRLWNLMGMLVVAALVLAACGPAATPAPTAAPTAVPTEAPVVEPTEVPPTEAPTEVPAPEELVFGVILVGPYNDHGWSEAHFTAAEYAVEKVPNARFEYQ